jgi:hypothetical protein
MNLNAWPFWLWWWVGRVYSSNLMLVEKLLAGARVHGDDCEPYQGPASHRTGVDLECIGVWVNLLLLSLSRSRDPERTGYKRRRVNHPQQVTGELTLITVSYPSYAHVIDNQAFLGTIWAQ